MKKLHEISLRSIFKNLIGSFFWVNRYMVVDITSFNLIQFERCDSPCSSSSTSARVKCNSGFGEEVYFAEGPNVAKSSYNHCYFYSGSRHLMSEHILCLKAGQTHSCVTLYGLCWHLTKNFMQTQSALLLPYYFSIFSHPPCTTEESMQCFQSNHPRGNFQFLFHKI